MSAATRPWRDHAALVALARDWDRRFAGRVVARVGGGPGWLRLSLDAREGDGPPAQLFLTAIPRAPLAWDADRSPPPAVLDALGRIPARRLTAAPHLRDAVLTCVVAARDDRVLALDLRRPDGARLHLLAQLFGQRGNLVLLDDAGVRLWSVHGSPHPAVLDPPAATAPPRDDPDTVAALRAAAPAHLATVLRDARRERHGHDLRRAREAAARLTVNLGRDLAAAEDGALWRRRGETLAIHLHALGPSGDEVTLPDAAGEPVRIPLDPRRPPHADMEACFRRARKAERGRATVARRLEEAQARAAALADAAAALEALDAEPDDVDALAALAAWHEAHGDLLPRRDAGGGRAPASDVTEPFRRFLLDGRWEVWVGRSAAENDELTHRGSHPRDWWFHAQGVAGSHVVLRTGGRPDLVPRAVRTRAAAIAAWFSKSRTSGIVPVLMTERRYVRRPRKSPPGTAATLRHESLMVTPGLPED